MKLVILAGGLGTRISEETIVKPKPMIEIGGKPILWHILKLYSHFGINEFIICCGYKGYVIKEYFANYFLHNSDVTFDISQNSMEVHQKFAEPWKVTLVDTGEETMTGGRLKRIEKYIKEESFCFTYGNGLSNINIKEQIEFHMKHNKIATIAAIQPPGRYGSLDIVENKVKEFIEKPKGDGGYINGGFFILKPEVFKFIKEDATVWENDPLQYLAKSENLIPYIHDGFWHAMDTLRDKKHLEELWVSGKAPWKLWK